MPVARDLSPLRDNQGVGVGLNICTLNGREMPASVFSGAEEVQITSHEPKQLRELVTGLLPMARHVLLRRSKLAGQPLHLHYIDPEKSLSANSDALRDFIDSIQNTRAVWMPISGNASLILHTLRQVLPLYGAKQLALLNLLYVGESTLQPLLQLLATDSGMDFSFHALY